MSGYDHITVQSADEVPALLGDRNSRILAGGTELVTGVEGTRLIDITQLESLCYIRERGSRVEVGALISLQQLADSMLLRAYAPALGEACMGISEAGIRERATLGGNLCCKRMAADCLTALMALKAKVTVKTDSDYREIELERFVNLNGGNTLNYDELITKISFPIPAGLWGGCFNKIDDINAAAQMILDENGCISAARIAVGGCAPSVRRARAVEKYLKGKNARLEVFQEAAALIRKDIDDNVDDAEKLITVLLINCLDQIRDKQG